MARAARSSSSSSSWRPLRLGALALGLALAVAAAAGTARARGGPASADPAGVATGGDARFAVEADSGREHAPSVAGERLSGAEPRIAFAVDVSRSMAWTSAPFVALDGAPAREGSRLDRARVELARALAGLPANARFNIITFNQCVTAWKPGAVLATDAAREDALAFVARACASGSSNAAAAVLRALEDAPIGTVVLLTDGAPTYLDCERRFAADGETHRHLIEAGNVQGARIDCVGIEPDPAARAFLEGVAHDSGGRFVAID